MNNIFIKELIIDISNDIINKYIIYKIPFRLVMIKSKYCYICDKTTEIDCNYRYVDTYIKNKMIGWIYCSKCKYKVDMGEYHYYNNCNVLPYSLVKKLFNKKIVFYRLSSLKKKTIIDNAILLEYSGDILRIWDKNKIGIMVSWEKEKIVYSKCIPLYNVIYFNRNLFGYSIKKFPIKNLNNKWIQFIKKNYNYLYNWEILLMILNKYNILIPKELIRNIFYFWFQPNLIKTL
jgi:hypothetical protein